MRANHDPIVLAFGDSLTAGYGLAAHASFARRLDTLLRVDRPGARVLNAGVSGDTTEDGLYRLPGVLTALAHKPDLAIVELGANDLLRGVPPSRTRANLDAILEELGRCDIPVLLATMEAPAFLGPIAASYNCIYPALAAKHRVPTAPFFPAGILGHPDYVLADRLHPNEAAIERIAEAFAPAVLRALGTLRYEAA